MFLVVIWNRRVDFLDGELTVFYFNSFRSFLIIVMFGECFLCVCYKDKLVDSGSFFVC